MGTNGNNEDCILELSLKHCTFQPLEKKFSSSFPYLHAISKHTLSEIMIKTLSTSKGFAKVNTIKTAKGLHTVAACYLNY